MLSPRKSASSALDQEKALQDAFQHALAFPLGRISSLAITPRQAAECAEQEAAFQTISVDDEGLSGGMRVALLQPMHAVMAEWRQRREAFNILLQPKMADIQAVEQLQAEADAEIKQKDDELAAIERELRQSPRYEDIDRHKQRAEVLYESFLNRHANRAAVMFAKNPFYWLMIGMVGVTEWFINFNAFYQFFHVIAFAAGTTVILAVLLALSSHGHGEVLKQWSYRFGPQRDPAKRWTDWRIFGMSTAGFVIVLGFTGAARYVAALDFLGSQAQTSALGSVGIVQVNPLRDVAISLLANIGAWMVGVIISSFAHDADPEYMDATRQYRKIRKKWNKARAHHTVRLKHIEAKHAKAIQDKITVAQTRLASVSRELDMSKQVQARDGAVQAEFIAVIGNNVEAYRDALARIALSRAGQVQIVKGDARTPLSPFDYKAMRIPAERIISHGAAAA
jgi:hypothetical protein